MCDIETAKTIYWLLSPTYIYEKYDSLENCPKEDYNCYDDAKLLMTIEEKVKNGVLKQDLLLKKCFYDSRDRGDRFLASPYKNIPEFLRRK